MKSSSDYSTAKIESDDELLKRYALGDSQALETLFCRYRDIAYRVSYRLLGNSEDALDAVQEGFIKALRKIDGFEQRSSFKTWLLRVVSNASIDLGRQRQRREQFNAQSIARAKIKDRERHEEVASDRVADENDLREALNRALEELPEPQRRTFVLHVEGGLNYREVAETLGISIGTVMSRLYYARQKLRVLMAERVSL